MSDTINRILILGIGNVLLGDEGAGVHAVRYLEEMHLPEKVTCLDGGTGGFHLLGPVKGVDYVILIDATVDGCSAGTVHRYEPKFSSDYPATLTAHDFGLKDLLDALQLLDVRPEVILYAISIVPLRNLSIELSAAVKAAIPVVAARVDVEVNRLINKSFHSCSFPRVTSPLN